MPEQLLLRSTHVQFPVYDTLVRLSTNTKPTSVETVKTT